MTGTGKLVRLILRRDRWIMPLWILVLVGTVSSYVSSFKGLFPTAAERQHYADVSNSNAGFIALYGRLSGSSLGELVAWRAGFIPVVIGVIAVLTVIRHTRTEEDTGRRELLGATVVGRHATLAAALVTTFAASLVLGGLLALALSGQGLPAAGSMALGLQFAAAGWMFAAVGAVAAQLTTGAGAARGIAMIVVGAAYLIRIPGDTTDASWLSWLSPIGWIQRLEPYHSERWWVLALPVAFAAALIATAVALSARRDVGAGLFPARPGPASASAGLRSPLALAWRLHRGLLASWTVGFAVVGVVLGGVAESVGDIVGDSQTMRDIIARLGGRAGLIDAYLAADLGLLGMVAAAYAIQATLRLRAEETSQRAEPILATGVSRVRWAASHLAFSVIGPTVALAAAGLTMGLTHGANTGQVGREVSRVLAGAAVQLPAVWVLAAVAVALVGLAPKLAPAAWAGFAICLLIGLVGAALQLDQWLLDVSPFTHVPRIPGGAMSAMPLVWLAVVALALAGAGLVGLRRRDIPVG